MRTTSVKPAGGMVQPYSIPFRRQKDQQLLAQKAVFAASPLNLHGSRRSMPEPNGMDPSAYYLFAVRCISGYPFCICTSRAYAYP